MERLTHVNIYADGTPRRVRSSHWASQRWQIHSGKCPRWKEDCDHIQSPQHHQKSDSRDHFAP